MLPKTITTEDVLSNVITTETGFSALGGAPLYEADVWAWSDLESAEAAIRADARESAFFSANVEDTRVLNEMKHYIADAAESKSGFSREAFLQKFKLNEGEGGVARFGSYRRLELIYDTQTARLAGRLRYASLVAGARVAPYGELFRAEPRREPRDWPARWRANGGTLYEGRMIAPIESPIWQRISAFGLPYPPFDYNSGMNVRALTLRAARDIGVPEIDKPPSEDVLTAKMSSVCSPTLDEADVSKFDKESVQDLLSAVSGLGVAVLFGSVLFRVGRSAFGASERKETIIAASAQSVALDRSIKYWTFSSALSGDERAVAASIVTNPSAIVATSPNRISVKRGSAIEAKAVRDNDSAQLYAVSFAATS